MFLSPVLRWRVSGPLAASTDRGPEHALKCPARSTPIKGTQKLHIIKKRSVTVHYISRLLLLTFVMLLPAVWPANCRPLGVKPSQQKTRNSGRSCATFDELKALLRNLHITGINHRTVSLVSGIFSLLPESAIGNWTDNSLLPARAKGSQTDNWFDY